MILNFEKLFDRGKKNTASFGLLQIFRVQFMVDKLRITKTAVNIMTTQRFTVHI